MVKSTNNRAAVDFKPHLSFQIHSNMSKVGCCSIADTISFQDGAFPMGNCSVGLSTPVASIMVALLSFFMHVRDLLQLMAARHSTLSSSMILGVCACSRSRSCRKDVLNLSIALSKEASTGAAFGWSALA